jgi:DNA gyrase subunit A
LSEKIKGRTLCRKGNNKVENELQQKFDLPESVQNLVNGYLIYAEEVIKDRALPDGRDGLKPVNRHILYSLHEEKNKGLVKSANACGLIMGKYHPHSLDAIYQALVRMTDKKGALNIPVVKGQGSFGKVYNTDKAANYRYTHCQIHDNAEDYFGEMDGVTFIPNFDVTTTEPELLPVKYPALLCNSVSGIAVGFSCNIPSFNLKDVCELVKEYVTKGECTTVICPDFTTGGYYIQDNKELQKLMKTGKAKLKLRGRVEIIGKEIHIREVPYGATLQSIKKQIEKKNIQWVKNVSDYDDFEHGADLCVECSAKGRVEEVLLSLYRDTDLQMTFSADMTSIMDGEPQRHGVWDYVSIWVEWRKQVLQKQFKADIEGYLNANKYSKGLMDVISDTELRDKVVDAIVHKTDVEAQELIREKFPDMSTDVIVWIVNRRANQFRDGGKYKKQYEKNMAEISRVQGDLEDLNAAIARQMDEVIEQRALLCERKTEITNTDYNFLERGKTISVSKDTTACYYVYNNGFLQKLRYADENTQGKVIQATASDTLIAIDNRGRILRVYCETLQYTGKGEIGLFLPKYFGVESSDTDYEIKWIDKLDGQQKMLVYADGNVGFLDTSDWSGMTRQVKIVERGVSVNADTLAWVGDVPEYLFVLDNKSRIACEFIGNIKRKSRTARTKVFNLEKGCYIKSIACKNMPEALGVLQNISRYQNGKPVYLEKESDYIAPEGTFTTITK